MLGIVQVPVYTAAAYYILSISAVIGITYLRALHLYKQQ